LENDEEAIEPPKPGKAYYIEGPVSRSRSWEPKRNLLAAPGAQTVTMTAGEINAWMAAKFRMAAPPTDEQETDVLILPGVPNVAFAEDGDLYLNLPATISAYGASNDFTISSKCALSATGLRFKNVHISSAKVPFVEQLGARIFEVLAQGYQETEEYGIITQAFARADSVQIKGSALVFELR
jgi:hypothetical protein